jgi:vitamin B12 transporter
VLPRAGSAEGEGKFHPAFATRPRFLENHGRLPAIARGSTLRTIIIAAGTLSLALTGAAAAQEAGTDDQGATKLDRILLTPNRTPTEQSMVGSTVNQVTNEEIEQKSLPTVTDYLNLLPGVAIAATGGPGAIASLSVRGLPQQYVKTLYNGIDISDPSGTQVQTAYQYLLTGGTDNIEVLKGSQGTLYGADAIAGVINISTLGGVDLGVHHILELEGGSFGTVRGRYGLRAASEDSKFALNATGFRTDGISSADGGTERDGFHDAMLDVNGEHRFSDVFSVFGSGLYINSKADFDDSGPVRDNPFNYNRSKQLAGRVGFNLDLMDGRLKNTLSVQGYGVDRDIHTISASGSYDANYKGYRTKIDYQGSFEATERLLLQYGADHEKQTARTSDNSGADTDDSASITGVWAQAVVEPVDDLVLTVGLRHDEHSQFGGYTTYRGTASYLFDRTGTRLHSSFGTGFRAPSLYELYAPPYTIGVPPVGNENLRPETSKSFDFGVEQSFIDGSLTADITYFAIDIDNLIVYDFLTSRYQQTSDTTTSRGIEASFSYAATNWLDLGGSYTYTDSKASDGTRTARVPRNAVVLSGVIRPAEKWTISADVKYVADIVDTGDIPLKDHVLLDAKVSYRPNENTEFYVRGENLFNEHYQEVAGYGTPGISVFTGVKAKF